MRTQLIPVIARAAASVWFVLLSSSAVHVLGDSAAADIIVHTMDFIDDGARSAFNGFEHFADIGFGVAHSYEEDGIKVDRMSLYVPDNPPFDEPAILGAPDVFGEGVGSWIHNGWGYSFTRITHSDGSDFESVGFLVGDGWAGPEFVTVVRSYELFRNGSLVSNGTMTHLGPLLNGLGFVVTGGYLGFSGGGFDEIRLRSSGYYTISGIFLGDDLFLDSIETAGNAASSPVPEPTSLALIGMAAVGFCGASWRRFRSGIANQFKTATAVLDSVSESR